MIKKEGHYLNLISDDKKETPKPSPEDISYANERGVCYRSEKVRCQVRGKVVTGWHLAKHKRTKKCMATPPLDHLVPKNIEVEPIQPVRRW